MLSLPPGEREPQTQAAQLLQVLVWLPASAFQEPRAASQLPASLHAQAVLRAALRRLAEVAQPQSPGA
jgi:hypothetical protein